MLLSARNEVGEVADYEVPIDDVNDIPFWLSVLVSRPTIMSAWVSDNNKGE